MSSLDTHTTRANLWFLCSRKQLGVFLLPPGWESSPLQGYHPVINLTCDQAFFFLGKKKTGHDCRL